jgi:putative nucleotidyltransferase with HDIG domain
VINLLSYNEALDLLNRYGKNASWVQHCLAVSRLAAYFSETFAVKYALDPDFIRCAALLHDIGRYKTHHPVLHGVEGYKLLVDLGYPKEAFICASHVFLNSEEALSYGLPKRDFLPSSFEEKLIPLVDFLVEHDRPTSLEERFKSLRERHNGNKDFLTRIKPIEFKTRAFMHQLNREFNLSVEEIARKICSSGLTK